MILFRLLVLFLTFALVACSSSSNKEKPNKLTSITQKVSIEQRWRKKLGAGLSKYYRVMAPTIDQGTLYAVDFKGVVFAIDRESGKIKWRKKLKLDVAAGVGAKSGLVFIGSLNGDVVALDAKNGEEQWRVNLASEILSSPQSNGAVVVVQTNDGKLIGLDSKSGESIWTFTTQLPILTLRGTATPQVLGPNIVAGFANGKLAALSAVDGTLYWERRIARPQGRSDIERVVDIDGSPIISNQLIYATSYNGSLSALSPRGEIIWSQTSSSYSSPVVINGRVFVTTAKGHVKAFDANTGLELWENTGLTHRKLSAPQNLSGFLMAADFEGYVHVFDSETGAVIDRFRVDDDGVRSPMISDGRYLYVLGNDGVLSSLAVYLFKS